VFTIALGAWIALCAWVWLQMGTVSAPVALETNPEPSLAPDSRPIAVSTSEPGPGAVSDIEAGSDTIAILAEAGENSIDSEEEPLLELPELAVSELAELNELSSAAQLPEPSQNSEAGPVESVEVETLSSGSQINSTSEQRSQVSPLPEGDSQTQVLTSNEAGEQIGESIETANLPSSPVIEEATAASTASGFDTAQSRSQALANPENPAVENRNAESASQQSASAENSAVEATAQESATQESTFVESTSAENASVPNEVGQSKESESASARLASSADESPVAERPSREKGALAAIAAARVATRAASRPESTSNAGSRSNGEALAAVPAQSNINEPSSEEVLSPTAVVDSAQTSAEEAVAPELAGLSQRQRREELSVLSGLSARLKFEPAGFERTPRVQTVLDRIFDPLFLYADTRVEVIVNSNDLASPADNRDLSRSRGRVIVDYLTERGLATSRFVVVSEGGRGLAIGTHRVQMIAEVLP